MLFLCDVYVFRRHRRTTLLSLSLSLSHTHTHFSLSLSLSRCLCLSQAPSNHTLMRLKVNSSEFPCRLAWMGGRGGATSPPSPPIAPFPPSPSPTAGAPSPSSALIIPSQPLILGVSSGTIGAGYAGCGLNCTTGWAIFEAVRDVRHVL
jgi:hypothetical protein